MTKDEEQMLDECLDAESGLSAWELDFIDNLDHNWRGRDLTERQHETLERIVGKVL